MGDIGLSLGCRAAERNPRWCQTARTTHGTLPVKRADVPEGRWSPPRQDRPLNGCGPELSDRGIDCTFSLTPAKLRVSQLWLPVGLGGGDQALDPDADPPDTGSVELEPVVEGQRVSVNLVRHIGWCRRSDGAGQLGEVGEAHRDRHGAPEHALLAHTGRRTSGHPQELATYDSGIIGITAQCLL